MAVLRPRLSRRIAGLITVAATVAVSGAVLTGLAPAAHATGADNGTVLGHLNALRASHGLPALSESGDLMSIAATHSAAMAHSEKLYHNPALTTEVQNWQTLGENVGMGPSATSIDIAFDNSPEHFANEINSSYTQVGIGTASDSRGYLYITVDFRKPMYAAAAPAPAPARTTTAPTPTRTTVPSRSAAPAAPSAADLAAAAARARAAARAAARSQALVRQRALVAAVRRSAAAVRPLAGSDPLAQAVDFSRTLTSLAG